MLKTSFSASFHLVAPFMGDNSQQLPASLILELLREVKDEIRNLRSDMLERLEQVRKHFILG